MAVKFNPGGGPAGPFIPEKRTPQLPGNRFPSRPTVPVKDGRIPMKPGIGLPRDKSVPVVKSKPGNFGQRVRQLAQSERSSGIGEQVRKLKSAGEIKSNSINPGKARDNAARAKRQARLVDGIKRKHGKLDKATRMRMQTAAAYRKSK